MSSSSPDITELKSNSNEQELIQALDYQDDPDIPGRAAEALAGMGSIMSLEPLCRLMEDSEQSTEFRIRTAAAIGDICARYLKVLNLVNPDSLSDDELRSHLEKERILSWAGSRLKLSMKTGPVELRKAASSAYLILPLQDNSDIMKAFSNSSTVTFQSTSAATDAFAQLPDESDAPQYEPREKDQTIAIIPEESSNDINEKAVDKEEEEEEVVEDKEEEIVVEDEEEEEEIVVEDKEEEIVVEDEEEEIVVEDEEEEKIVVEDKEEEIVVEDKEEEEEEEEEEQKEEVVVEDKEEVPEPVVESKNEVQAEAQKKSNIEDSSEPKLDELVEIAPNTYLIGNREGSLLERNIYLRVFSDGEKTVNLLIDPGPPQDLPALTSALSSKIGGLENINVMFLNHQDPDIAYNAGHVQKLNPDCVVLCSEDSWRLVKFYGLNPMKYKAIEQLKDLTLEMDTGHRLRFVPSPYCHFRGAVMLYDEETGVIFTGDFLGGLSFKPDLFASEDSWDGISTFHQIYMPCRAAIRNAVNNIRNLDPQPEIIAPQHGSIISGGLIDDFLSQIENLEVGIDLFLKEHSKENYIEVMNELLLEFGRITGPAIKTEVLNGILSDSSFPSVISLGANGIHDIKVDPYFALGLLLSELRSKTPPEIWKTAEISVLKVLTRRKITIPDCMLLKAGDEMASFQ